MRLYQAHVLDSFDSDGLRFFLQFGEQVTIDGTEYVREHTSLHERSDRWHASRGDALRCVADKVESMAGRLADQAARLRQQAAEAES